MRKRLTKKTKIIFCMLSAIIFALLIWTIWGNTALTVNNIKISSSRIPAVFSGFRIAQVSDLHNAEFGKGNKKLLELLSESKPDIIVITGDFVDAGHTDIDVAFDFAKVAVNIAPVYYVTGNHEARTAYRKLNDKVICRTTAKEKSRRMIAAHKTVSINKLK
ncbi:hypothetical protein D1841_08610 [Neglecta sp. X4]|nr:hypothetical protein [Neglectibacter sp. 59]NBJ73361.1 hypothetical protein [Neglectibacter sp. X4]NCE82330.1 hypothetical protein [Neglectibacter sp. X58]